MADVQVREGSEIDMEEKDVILDSVPGFAYKNFYKKQIEKILQNNSVYTEARNNYAEAYRALYSLLYMIEEESDDFKGAVDILKRMCEDMRMIADLECGELMSFVRSEYGQTQIENAAPDKLIKAALKGEQ